MIHHMTALQYLEGIDFYRGAMFADIPDNIGLKYEGFVDSVEQYEYESNIDLLIRKVLDKCSIFWLSYNKIHDLWLSARIWQILNNHKRQWEFMKVLWRYTFGQYTNTKISSGYRPIALFLEKGIVLNLDAVRIQSERQRLGDKRASGLRVPDDVWEYPRVVGNAKERRNWHPTQHPEMLMERIVLLSCTQTVQGKTSNIGGFTDLFLGSGTSARVCKKLGIPFEGVDVSLFYCRKVAEELGIPAPAC